MQKHFNLKHVALLLGLLLPAVWCGASNLGLTDGHSHILIKEGNIHSSPKGSSIHAPINGHLLMVTFTENLGQVAVEVTTATGSPVDATSTITPND